MSRSYGILFSEYSDKKYDVENLLACLESLRKELEKRFPNPDYEFDIIEVTSHSSENSYPEIGIHCAGEISDSVYEKLEQFVIQESLGKDINSVAMSLQKPKLLTWEFLKNSGNYPVRRT